MKRPDKEQLETLLSNNSIRDISKKLEVHENTVRNWLKKYDINNSLPKETFSKEDRKILKHLQEKGFTPKDVKNFVEALEKQEGIQQKEYKVGKNKVKIGVSGDWHVGNIHTDYKLLDFYMNETSRLGVDLHLNTGDLADGWYQNRPASIFEQNHIGFDQQFKRIRELFNQFDKPVYFITGNHSYNTFVRNAGIELGPHLEDMTRLDGVESYFLGNAEGDVQLKGGAKIKLLHPDGGTAYALSYRPQKIVESLESGHKPNVLLIGHYHKAEQLFYRNVHTFQTGTMMGQTKFMRGKSIPAHKAFWILDIESNDSGEVTGIESKLYPAYK